MGRHSTFTAEIADEICLRISAGESLRSILETDGMPASSNVFKWLEEKKDFQEQYTRARSVQSDMLFDDISEIAEAGLKAVDAVEVSARKLLIDTQRWRLAKMLPKKYGDKLAVGGDDSMPPIQYQRIERVIVRPANPDA